MDEQSPAVWVRGVGKHYGSGKNKLQVMTGLNMTVPHGAIYGLLGPSGCGKTTLLRCIIGRLNIDYGNIVVLGDTPGAKNHGIPGNMVGYMPQDTALYNEFSILDTLMYFGRLHGMDRREIKHRTKFLLDFLSLPSRRRLIKELSGGQKRRVSFAVALLQEPELLILDEPTVGVDPVLREKIWSHLMEITQGSHHTTVIITTHYIEEARQADVVGLMRNGCLLAESAPADLMLQYSQPSLEDVFLKLCRDDENARGHHPQCPTLNSDTQDFSHAAITAMDSPDLCTSTTQLTLSVHHRAPHGFIHVLSSSVVECCTCPKLTNMAALIIKNLTIMKRNLGFLLFEFMLPSIQIILFCLCIGKDPYDLNIGIVNNDHGPFGGWFIQRLDNRTFHMKMNYSDLNEALSDVRAGNSWGVIHMGENFTSDLVLRFRNMSSLSNDTISGGSVKLNLDMTNQQISLIIQERVAEAFQSFMSFVLELADLPPGLAQLPIQLEDPVFGTRHPSFTNFMAPAIILSTTFFLATGLTALSFIMEKKEGLLDRSLVAGVSSVEIMLSHVCTQLMVMVVQVGLLLVFALIVFKVPYNGPLIWVILLVLLQGFCGMALGLVISAACDNENSATQLALGSMYPMLLLSGIIWPVEAIPHWLWYVSISLPMTYAGEAMRCVLSRGWSMLNMPVWRGYVVTIGWGAGLLLLAHIIMKISSNGH
ncbi:ABC transporter G family member 23-like [Liolophura sinensis]|uniref:ABC transporter G family member 23-like n=1 Tax=Liolophura sinensis TaxID=3198878 RepID=UPI0031581F89